MNKKKYPIHKNYRYHLWLSLGLGIWVFVFLYVAEPFDIYRFTASEKLIFLPIYGVIQSICYCIPLGYQNKYNKRSWYVQNELVFILMMVISGFVINFLFYKNVIVYEETNTYAYYHYFKWIYVPALAIILPFILIGRYIMGRFYESSEKIEANKILVKGKGKYDFISLVKEDLVFIQSSDNYVDIYFLEGQILKKKTLRETISTLENSFDFLMKTHRSFLINPIHFKQFYTEGKKLYLDVGHEKKIPVSRNLQTVIKSKLPVATNR